MASHSSVFRGRHATQGKEGPLSLLFELTKILFFAVGGEAIKVANRHRGILLTELLNSHKLSYLFQQCTISDNTCILSRICFMASLWAGVSFLLWLVSLTYLRGTAAHLSLLGIFRKLYPNFIHIFGQPENLERGMY